MHEYVFSQSRLSLEKWIGRSAQPLSWRMGKAHRDVLADVSEALFHSLADGLQRFEARASLGVVQPHASLGFAMVR